MPKYDAGAPCWIDLGTPDPSAAAAFYSDLLGWQVEPPDGDGYRLCRLNGQLVAGLGPGTDTGAPYWTTNVSVADVEATIPDMVASGGHIVAGPGTAGDLGRFAVGTDAEGTPLSLWQPGSHAGAEVIGVAGTWAHTELVSAQPDLARSFYRTVFGWEENCAPGAPAITWTLGNSTVATLRPQPPEWPSGRASLWIVHFAVADIDATVAQASILGASLPVALPGPETSVLLADNQGALFGLRMAEPR